MGSASAESRFEGPRRRHVITALVVLSIFWLGMWSYGHSPSALTGITSAPAPDTPVAIDISDAEILKSLPSDDGTKEKEPEGNEFLAEPPTDSTKSPASDDESAVAGTTAIADDTPEKTTTEVKVTNSDPAPIKNAALIIENRPLPNMIPLILHFSSVLGPDWPIYFFTDLTKVTISPPLQRAIDEKRVILRGIPAGQSFKSHFEVSLFLTKPWIWNQLAPAKHVLLFQADSIICANAPQRIEDYLEWDYIGSPIRSGFGAGFNGGFSLRNREMVLEIVDTWDFSFENRKGDEGPTFYFEDQWFYQKFQQLPDNDDGTKRAKIPDINTAKTFGVESVYYDKPLGYHQVSRWNMEILRRSWDGVRRFLWL